MTRRRLNCLVAAVCFSAGFVLAQTYDPDIQRSFLEGAHHLQAGDYEAAAGIFRALLSKTDSPRIKLELARALFHLKQYQEARALFREVLMDPGIPWRVRDNVEAFIREIDNIEGYLKFSLSVVSDSNPRNLSSQREFTISGIRLTYLPPPDNKKVTGLRYLAQGYQPLSQEGRLAGYFAGSYTDFPGYALDRLTVDAGLIRDVTDSGRARVKAGVEFGTFGDQRLYDFPYVGFLHVISQSVVHRVTGEYRVGRVNFPDYGYLDATYTSATLSAFKAISQTTAVTANGALEYSRAEEQPYTYYGITFTPGVTWFLTEPAVLLKTDVSLGTRQYAAIDPFFGEQRSDVKTRLDLSVRGKQWRWRNFGAALVLSFEKNRSNIDFYEYRKVNVSIVIE
jgi:hypothetical protein